jgi:hypothetical protein
MRRIGCHAAWIQEADETDGSAATPRVQHEDNKIQLELRSNAGVCAAGRMRRAGLSQREGWVH